MDNGWIKLHRKFLEWYDKPEMVQLFIFLLLVLMQTINGGEGIKTGALVTSYASIKAKNRALDPNDSHLHKKAKINKRN